MAITGVWSYWESGAVPPAGPGAELLVRKSGGAATWGWRRFENLLENVQDRCYTLHLFL